MRSKKDTEGEVALCRSIFVVSLRDMLSKGANPYTNRCKEEAEGWIDTDYENNFSFSNVITYTFGEEVDSDRVRGIVKRMLKNKNVSGTRNLYKLLGSNSEDSEDNGEDE